MGRPLEAAWVGPKVGWGSVSESPEWDKQYEPGWWSLRHVAHQSALWLCGGRLRKWTVASASTSVWEKAAPPALALMPDNSFPPCISQMFSICCHSAEAQRELFWVSLCMGPLRGTARESIVSVFHSLNPHWFLQPEVTATSLPDTGSLGWVAWCWAGTLCSLNIPSYFYLPHACVGPAHSVSLPLLPATV